MIWVHSPCFSRHSASIVGTVDVGVATLQIFHRHVSRMRQISQYSGEYQCLNLNIGNTVGNGYC